MNRSNKKKLDKCITANTSVIWQHAAHTSTNVLFLAAKQEQSRTHQWKHRGKKRQQKNNCIHFTDKNNIWFLAFKLELVTWLCWLFLAARILGADLVIHSLPALFFFFFSLSGNQIVHTYSTLYARSSPQWFNKLRWLWPSVPRWVACELEFPW